MEFFEKFRVFSNFKFKSKFQIFKLYPFCIEFYPLKFGYFIRSKFFILSSLILDLFKLPIKNIKLYHIYFIFSYKFFFRIGTILIELFMIYWFLYKF